MVSSSKPVDFSPGFKERYECHSHPHSDLVSLNFCPGILKVQDIVCEDYIEMPAGQGASNSQGGDCSLFLDLFNSIHHDLVLGPFLFSDPVSIDLSKTLVFLEVHLYFVQEKLGLRIGVRDYEDSYVRIFGYFLNHVSDIAYR